MNMMLLILSITILLFIWGKYRPDVVALMSMLSLYFSGILELGETFSGFSNSTVIMIAALFIVGEGLSQTGWTALAGKKLIQWASGSIPKLLIFTTLGSGLLSGFVSNTGTVATLMPITISSAWNIGTMPSKLLMPAAFGSNTGGLLTLTGTPPNIIVSNTLAEKGFEQFSFFEFGLIGLPLLIIAVLYFRYIGYRLLPSYKTKNRPVNLESEMHRWVETYNIENDYYRLRVRSSSPLIKSMIKDWTFEKKYGIIITRIRRKKNKRSVVSPQFIEYPGPEEQFNSGDIITVKGGPAEVDRLMLEFDLAMQPIEDIEAALEDQVIGQEVGMAEVIVVPKSSFVGRKIKIGDYFRRFGIQLLGASRNNKPIKDPEMTVRAGDSFLIRGSWENIEALTSLYENLVLCGSPEGLSKVVPTLTYRSYISISTLILMIILLVFDVMPGSVAVLLCAGIMVVTRCVPKMKIYNGISWVSVIMIAAMIPMGLALQKTGLAKDAADALVGTLGSIHPLAMLGGVFLLTSLFSQVINNSATAVLMAPIAIIAATSLGLSPKPFMAAVAVSASTAFLTPVGTTTNAMVMAAGGYKFKDYLKVGAPLLILFLVLSLSIIPLIWPF